MNKNMKTNENIKNENNGIVNNNDSDNNETKNVNKINLQIRNVRSVEQKIQINDV